MAWLLSAGTLAYVGQTKKAIEHAERGLRLSPFDRGLYYYYMFLTLAHYADGAYEEAIKWGRLAMNENPQIYGYPPVLSRPRSLRQARWRRPTKSLPQCCCWSRVSD